MPGQSADAEGCGNGDDYREYNRHQSYPERDRLQDIACREIIYNTENEGYGDRGFCVYGGESGKGSVFRLSFFDKFFDLGDGGVCACFGSQHFRIVPDIN